MAEGLPIAAELRRKDAQLLPPVQNQAKITGSKPYQDRFGKHFIWELHLARNGQDRKMWGSLRTMRSSIENLALGF